jgi:outer membrane biosynthesis protein TonB
MSLPPRIFVALGDQSEVDSLASNDLSRKADQQMIDNLRRELREAKESLARTEDELIRIHGHAQTAKWGTGLLVAIVILAITLWLWLSRDSSPPPLPAVLQPPPLPQQPPPPQPPPPPHQPIPHPPPVRHEPARPPPSLLRWQPERPPLDDCFRCVPYYEEHEDVECWRNRSMRGCCFD